MLGGGGLPLGLFPVAQPGLEEVDLAKGDLLFFYTDGLTETRSPGMRYYEERLPDELVTLAGAAGVVAGVQARAEAGDRTFGRSRCASARACWGLLPFRDPLRFTEYRYTHGEAYYAQACRLGWEGIIGKRADAPDRAGRSRDWLKFKCEAGG